MSSESYYPTTILTDPVAAVTWLTDEHREAKGLRFFYLFKQSSSWCQENSEDLRGKA